MHFLAGIGFFILIMATTLVYTIAGFCLVVFLKRLFFKLYSWKTGKAQEKAKPLFTGYFQRFTRKSLVFLLSAFVAFHLSIYLKQRTKWMGKDNSNLVAKEYWVSGQVLSGIRGVLSIALGPDNYVLDPMTWLQERIYRTGSQYLPEDDGEIGVWMDVWFVHPFNRTFSVPRWTDDNKVSPRMIRLLEKCWFVLEKTGQFVCNDQEMEEFYALRNYPGAALYYTYYEGDYTGLAFGSSRVLCHDVKHVERSKRLSQWLIQLRDRWNQNEKIKMFINDNPKLEATRLVVLLFELEDVLRGHLCLKQWTCNIPEIEMYIQAKKDFFGDGIAKPAYQLMKEKDESQRLLKMVTKTICHEFMKYVLEKNCNKKVHGDYDISFFQGTSNPLEYRIKYIKTLYKEEIKAIEEKMYE